MVSSYELVRFDTGTCPFKVLQQRTESLQAKTCNLNLLRKCTWSLFLTMSLQHFNKISDKISASYSFLNSMGTLGANRLTGICLRADKNLGSITDRNKAHLLYTWWLLIHKSLTWTSEHSGVIYPRVDFKSNVLVYA